jgi:hypothetical protein
MGIFVALAVLHLLSPHLALFKNSEQNMIELYRKSWEREAILVGYGREHRINSTQIIRGELRIDIATNDWKSVKRKFLGAVRKTFGSQWYSENRFLLEVLEMEEYLGYEGSILDIIADIKSCSRLEELEQQVISQLIHKLQAQVESGGNTTFLDVDKMKDEESSRLVPIILEKRREHFLSAMDKYRASEREVDNLSDVLETNYGCKVATAIKKELGSPKAAGYIITQLNSVYESLLKDSSAEYYSTNNRRPRTRWKKLCKEIAMAHISHLIDFKCEVLFHHCNPNLSTMYESGYHDILSVLNQFELIPKLYNKEYKFILRILKRIKTKRSKKALEIVKLSTWKDMYVQG